MQQDFDYFNGRSASTGRMQGRVTIDITHLRLIGNASFQEDADHMHRCMLGRACDVEWVHIGGAHFGRRLWVHFQNGLDDRRRGIVIAGDMKRFASLNTNGTSFCAFEKITDNQLVLKKDTFKGEGPSRGPTKFDAITTPQKNNRANETNVPSG